MKIEIRRLFTGQLLFSHDAENNSMRLTLEAAALSGANLSGADLRFADLRGAALRGAALSGANLIGADLSGANLIGADLRGAALSGANLSGADLRFADLSGADLSGANLSGPDLSGPDLSGADLRNANLLPIKEDFIEIISQAPREVPALIEALRAGRVDGATYEGECACLVGTIANARHVSVDAPEFDIEKDSSRPAERFFLAIKKGDTPETNGVSKIALEWAEQWLATQRAAFSSAG